MILVEMLLKLSINTFRILANVILIGELIVAKKSNITKVEALFFREDSNDFDVKTSLHTFSYKWYKRLIKENSSFYKKRLLGKIW